VRLSLKLTITAECYHAFTQYVKRKAPIVDTHIPARSEGWERPSTGTTANRPFVRPLRQAQKRCGCGAVTGRGVGQCRHGTGRIVPRRPRQRPLRGSPPRTQQRQQGGRRRNAPEYRPGGAWCANQTHGCREITT